MEFNYLSVAKQAIKLKFLGNKKLSNILGYLDTLAERYRNYDPAENINEALPKQTKNQNLK